MWACKPEKMCEITAFKVGKLQTPSFYGPFRAGTRPCAIVIRVYNGVSMVCTATINEDDIDSSMMEYAKNFTCKVDVDMYVTLVHSNEIADGKFVPYELADDWDTIAYDHNVFYDHAVGYEESKYIKLNKLIKEAGLLRKQCIKIYGPESVSELSEPELVKRQLRKIYRPPISKTDVETDVYN